MSCETCGALMEEGSLLCAAFFGMDEDATAKVRSPRPGGR